MDAEAGTGRRWHVIQTKPAAEARVAVQLTSRMGVGTYLPRIEVKVSRGRRLVTAVRPLFPCYLFARLLLPEEWRVISFTRGAVRVLGGWEDPKSVPEEALAAIRERERGPDRLIEYYNFKPSERVVVRGGPLRDLEGIFDRYVDGRGRVRVLLDLMGCQASVELEAALLERG